MLLPASQQRRRVVTECRGTSVELQRALPNSPPISRLAQRHPVTAERCTIERLADCEITVQGEATLSLRPQFWRWQRERNDLARRGQPRPTLTPMYRQHEGLAAGVEIPVGIVGSNAEEDRPPLSGRRLHELRV